MMSEAEANSYGGRSEFTDKDAYKVYAGNSIVDYFATSTFVYGNTQYTRYIDEYPEFEAFINYDTQAASSAKVGAGEEIQVSIKAPKINSYVQTSASVLTKWMNEIYKVAHPDVTANYEITLFARSVNGSSAVAEFNDVVYIRIKAL